MKCKRNQQIVHKREFFLIFHRIRQSRPQQTSEQDSGLGESDETTKRPTNPNRPAERPPTKNRAKPL